MQVRAHVLGLRVAQLPVRWHARSGGVSKISGSLRGVFGAGLGILGMIARLWWRERRQPLIALAAPHPLPSPNVSRPVPGPALICPTPTEGAFP